MRGKPKANIYYGNKHTLPLPTPPIKTKQYSKGTGPLIIDCSIRTLGNIINRYWHFFAGSLRIRKYAHILTSPWMPKRLHPHVNKSPIFPKQHLQNLQQVEFYPDLNFINLEHLLLPRFSMSSYLSNSVAESLGLVLKREQANSNKKRFLN